jgi:small subunit ribosomal protein S21
LFKRSTDVQVFVKDGDVVRALRTLRKKLDRGGVRKEMRRREAFEKPSDRRRRKARAGMRRVRKRELLVGNV